jgi:Na+/proline symporter/signal transduction histidine kinase
MFPRWFLLFFTGGYLSVLFLIAYYAERREWRGRSIVSNPYVYSLSLAVYCTSWTFYGSVGKAAVSGLSFLAIYIGPTLAALLWPVVLRKIIGIAKRHRITTIADFIGSRYGNSILLAAIVTVVASVGITPYMGLQIKAIIGTFTIMAGESKGSLGAAWIITFIIALFATIFGVRRQDISEKHEGLVFAIAFESIVKLAAFLAVGLYVTFSLFGGFGDIFQRIEATEFANLLSLGEGAPVGYAQWASLTFLSMMAIIVLPRQFHMAVVENYDPAHVTKAAWLFPLYLLLINIFVLPVAFGGLLLGGSPSGADTFVLSIPLEQGKNFLALFVFIGGFSAASGMIIVESLAISNMVMNNIVSPAIWRFNRMRGFSIILSNVKRIIIMGFVFSGYLFAATVGEYFSLVDMGLISFVAVSIFAPSIIFGLYWKRGNRFGAVAGTVGGFVVWCYTLFLPALVTSGIFEREGVVGRIMRSELLNPHALLGVRGLDEWSHALFWGLLVNVGLYVAFSLFTGQTEEVESKALSFVESYEPRIFPVARSVHEIEAILSQFIGREESRRVIGRFLSQRGIDEGSAASHDLMQLQDESRGILSGMLGSSIASLVFEDRFAYTDQERGELLSTIKEMNKTLRPSRRELAAANRQLALLKEFSENIIESLPLGVGTLDLSLKVGYWNKGMEGITGVEKAEALGAEGARVLTCLPAELLSPRVKEGDVRCSAGGTNLEGYISRLTGATPGYVIILQDVTEKKKIEEELFQASRHASVGRLAAGVSHEIGNPLASISSLVQELVAEEQTAFGRDSLDTISLHIARIVRIVRNLGDFARINPRKKGQTSLAETLESTLALVRFDKNFKAIRIQADFQPVPRLHIDPDQMQQVFLNLVLNARDAMPEGGDLKISLRRAGDWVEVVFSDTGEGVESSIRDKVFDPFFTTKGPTRGTGLGLGVSYGIIKDHGGTIEMSSSGGQGASFVIRLPIGEGAGKGN